MTDGAYERDASETIDPVEVTSRTDSGARDHGDGARRFAGNVGWMLLSQGAGKIASFAFVIIVVRGLGTTEYGYFNFAISFVPLFLMLGAWGISIAVVSEVAKHRDRLSEVFSSGFVLRLGLDLVGLIACFAVTPLLVHSTEGRLTVIVVGCALFLDEISEFLANVFRAFEQMRYQSIVSLINRVVSAVLAVVAILVGGNLLAVAGMYFLGSAGALVFAWVTLKRRFPPIRLSDRRWPLMKDLLRSGVLVGIASVLNMALFRIDTVMLQAIRGTTEVAIYGIAYRFLDSFLFFAWGVTSAALPKIARAGNTQERVRSVEMTAALILAFFVPLAIWGVFSPRWMVLTLFGEKSVAAVPAVPWLAAAAGFYSLAYLARVVAIVDGRRATIAWIAAVGAIVNIGANAFAIPRYGFLGAAVATFASEVLDAALLVGLFVRSNRRLYESRVTAVPLAAGACMGVALAASGARGGAAFVVGGLVYLGALILCGRLIAPAESRRAIGLLRRRATATRPSA